jgi:hypothetical protein
MEKASQVLFLIKLKYLKYQCIYRRTFLNQLWVSTFPLKDDIFLLWDVFLLVN